MSTNFVDFRAVKERVSIEQVLEHFNIRLRRTNKTSLRGFCPLPTHTSEKSRESFGVDVEKKIWACQSISCANARLGKKGGNILDLVAAMESCSVREAALKMNEWFLNSEQSDVHKVKPSVTEKREPPKLVAEEGSDVTTGNAPLSFSLRGIDSTHPYVQARGITEETARDFGVGFFPGRGSMSGRVVIPIANERGQLVAYAGRSIDDLEPKYRFPSGFKKSEVLFNFSRATETPNCKTAIVVEGFFDTMKVAQGGFPNVVALMGIVLSDAQERLLEAFREIVLMLDGDQAGQTAVAGIVTRLTRSHFVRVVTISGQPDQLSSEEIQAVLAAL